MKGNRKIIYKAGIFLIFLSFFLIITPSVSSDDIGLVDLDNRGGDAIYYDVDSNGTSDIYVACGGYGLVKYSIVDNQLIYEYKIDLGSLYMSVVVDDFGYIHTGMLNGTVYSFRDTGSAFEQVNMIDLDVSQAYDIHISPVDNLGSILIEADDSKQEHIIWWDHNNDPPDYSELDEISQGTWQMERIISKGVGIVVYYYALTDDSTIVVYNTVDGVFNQIGAASFTIPGLGDASGEALYVSDDHVFVGSYNVLRALDFSAAENFSFLANFTCSEDYWTIQHRDMDLVSENVFVLSSENYVFVVSWSDALQNFTELAKEPRPGEPADVVMSSVSYCGDNFFVCVAGGDGLVLYEYLPEEGDTPVTINGYVYDVDGDPVPGATVETDNLNNSEGCSDITDSNGFYSIGCINASTGNIIRSNSSYSVQSGSNNTIVDTTMSIQWLNITMDTNITAFFSYSPSIPTIGQQVSFTDSSIGPVQEWLWDFGDGTTEIGKNQQHSYSSAGNYTVKLEVRAGTLSDTKRKNIKIVSYDDDNPSIIKPKPPKYPTGFSVDEMYQLLKVDKLSDSNAEIRVVYIDSGYTPREYMGTDLSVIEGYSIYESAIDENGHGTWVSYALTYILQDKLSNCEIISFRVFDKNGQCNGDQLLSAMELVKNLHPDIISFSGGIYGYPTDAFSHKVNELRNMGIVVVVAAGNLGPSPSTVMSPACADGAIAIAAEDPILLADNRLEGILDLSDDIIASWSSRGPVLDIYPKPDFACPGESIRGPWLDGETVKSGTSIAAPFFAGGIAVMKANNKDILNIVNLLYFWDTGIVPYILENSLSNTVYKKTPVDDFGWGIPDFETASSNVFFTCIIYLVPYIIAVVLICLIVVYNLIYKED